MMNAFIFGIIILLLGGLYEIISQNPFLFQ